MTTVVREVSPVMSLACGGTVTWVSDARGDIASRISVDRMRDPAHHLSGSKRPSLPGSAFACNEGKWIRARSFHGVCKGSMRTRRRSLMIAERSHFGGFFMRVRFVLPLVAI